MMIHSNLSTQIKEAQLDALNHENMAGEALRRMEKNLEIKSDEVRYLMNQIWTLNFDGFIEMIMDAAHKTPYFIHLGSDKMYLDLMWASA